MIVALKENNRFRRLYAKGNSAANRYLVIYCMRNGNRGVRIGLTVSTKLGHAVVRNRMRRRLREIAWANEDRFVTGYDIVVVARTAAVEADFAVLTKAYLSLAEKLQIVQLKQEESL